MSEASLTTPALALKDWRYEIDNEGIAWATFDREGASANALGRRPIEELERIVSAVEQGARDKSRARPRHHVRQGKGLHRRR